MQRPHRFTCGAASLALLSLALAGCGSSAGGYAGYTEYRVPPTKTDIEIRQERAEARERSSTKRGRVVDTGGNGILFGE